MYRNQYLLSHECQFELGLRKCKPSTKITLKLSASGKKIYNAKIVHHTWTLPFNVIPECNDVGVDWKNSEKGMKLRFLVNSNGVSKLSRKRPSPSDIHTLIHCIHTGTTKCACVSLVPTVLSG